MNFSLAATDEQRENLDSLRRKLGRVWQSFGPLVVFAAAVYSNTFGILTLRFDGRTQMKMRMSVS